MTPEQEARGAEMFAAGATEREVAAELGIGAGTANRLKKRLQARQEPGTNPAPETAGPEQHDEAVLQAADTVLSDETMTLLEAERDRLAGELENFQARHAASLAGYQALDSEEDHQLLTSGDTSGIDERRAAAAADLRKWARGIELITPQLAEVNHRIGQLHDYRELAGLRAQLDAAVAERDGVYARSGDRQRAAVAAVRAAAEDFCAVTREERAAVDKVAVLSSAVVERALRVGEVPPLVPPAVSTRLTAQGGAGGELALTRAMHQAERGDVAGVARHLGEVNGWLPPGPPSPEEQERMRQMAAERERQLAELRERQNAGPHADPDEAPVPVGTDHFGNPVDKYGNTLIPRHRMPQPWDIYGPGYAHTTGNSYGPGFRTAF